MHYGLFIETLVESVFGLLLYVNVKSNNYLRLLNTFNFKNHMVTLWKMGEDVKKKNPFSE